MNNPITAEELNRLVERQISHIQTQREIIAAQRSEIAALQQKIRDREIDLSYAEHHSQTSIDVSFQQQALIDQQAAHIEHLMERIAVLTEQLDETEYALAVAADLMQSGTQPHLKEN